MINTISTNFDKKHGCALRAIQSQLSESDSEISIAEEVCNMEGMNDLFAFLCVVKVFLDDVRGESSEGTHRDAVKNILDRPTKACELEGAYMLDYIAF